MNERTEPQNISNKAPGEPEMLALVKKIEQRLSFLEKKIDILIEKSSHKPFDKKRFSKPGYSGGYFRRRDPEKGGYRSGERKFGRPGSFDQSRGGQSRDRRPQHGQFRDGQSHSGQSYGYGHRKKRPFRPKRRH